MSTLTIVVLGGAGTEAGTYAQAPGRAVVRIASDELGVWPSLVAPGGVALVVAEHRHEDAARRHAAVASDLGIVATWRSSGLGPAALLITANSTMHLAAEPATAPSTFEHLAAATWSGAWMRSVGRLADPAPSIGQHARSLVGGEGYLVVLAPEPRVLGVATLRRRGGLPADLVAGIPHGGVLAHGDGLPPEIGQLLHDAVGLREAQVFALDPEAVRDRFGTADAVELAVTPSTAPYVPAGTVRCPGCALVVAPPTCPFCRVRVEPGTTRGVAA